MAMVDQSFQSFQSFQLDFGPGFAVSRAVLPRPVVSSSAEGAAARVIGEAESFPTDLDALHERSMHCTKEATQKDHRKMHQKTEGFICVHISCTVARA